MSQRRLLLLCGAVLLLMNYGVSNVGAFTIEQMIAVAKTPADHKHRVVLP